MAEDYRYTEAEIVDKKGVAQKRAAQRVCSRTMQNEMKGILVRMTTGAAQSILNCKETKEFNRRLRLLQQR